MATSRCPNSISATEPTVATIAAVRYVPDGLFDVRDSIIFVTLPSARRGDEGGQALQ